MENKTAGNAAEEELKQTTREIKNRVTYSKLSRVTKFFLIYSNC